MSRILSFALLLAAAAPAQAQDLELYRSVAGWDVVTVDGGCYAAANFGDGIEFYAGVDAPAGEVVLTILNPAWQEIGDGDPVPVDLTFGDAEFGEIVMTGVTNQIGLPGVSYAVSGEDPASGALMGDLMDEGDLRIWQNGQEIISLDMSGMGAAFLVVAECAGLG